MSAPKPTSITLIALDAIGAQAKPFLQGMLNRLAVGAIRYGRKTSHDEKCSMWDTAQWRLQIYRQNGDPQALIDAANFCLLEFWKVTEGKWTIPSDPGEDSPGIIVNGMVTGARGKYEYLNGMPRNYGDYG